MTQLHLIMVSPCDGWPSRSKVAASTEMGENTHSFHFLMEIGNFTSIAETGSKCTVAPWSNFGIGHFGALNPPYSLTAIMRPKGHQTKQFLLLQPQTLRTHGFATVHAGLGFSASRKANCSPFKQKVSFTRRNLETVPQTVDFLGPQSVDLYGLCWFSGCIPCSTSSHHTWFLPLSESRSTLWVEDPTSV